MKYINKYPKTFIFILTYSIAVVFLTLLPEQYRVNESSDYKLFYEPTANNLAFNNKFFLDNKDIAYKYPIGFPLILSFIFKLSSVINIDKNTLTSVFCVLSFSIASVLIYKISNKFWNKKKAGFSAIIFSLNPLILWTIKQPNSEVFFTPIFYLAILFFISLIKDKKHSTFKALIIGSMLGLSMLIRPISIFLPFVFCFSLFFLFNKSKKLQISFLIITSCFFTIFPWQYYLYKDSGKIMMLSNNGPDSIFDGLTFNQNHKKKYRIKKDYGENIEELMIEINQEFNNKEKKISEMILFMINKLKEKPVVVIKLTLIKVIKAIYGTDSQRKENYILAFNFFYLILALLSVNKVLNTNYDIRPYTKFIIVIFIYFIFMATIALSIVRYITPVLGILTIFIPSLYKNKSNSI